MLRFSLYEQQRPCQKAAYLATTFDFLSRRKDTENQRKGKLIRDLIMSGRKARGSVIIYKGDRYTWSIKGYWRSTAGDRHKLTHRIWEEHNGPVPKGHLVFYKDGDRYNLSVDNLGCCSRSERQKARMKDPEYRSLNQCFLFYGHLIKAIKTAQDPERRSQSALQAWRTRRARYGISGGNGTSRSETSGGSHE